VQDAGMCHGATGGAQIIYLMYLATKLPELYDACLYWEKKTVEMGYHKDGIAGYKYFYKDKWVNSTNLLTGVAGIGLSFMSEVNPDWDEVLLLSFKE
jgi:lantibiotic modifying enzyme